MSNAKELVESPEGLRLPALYSRGWASILDGALYATFFGIWSACPMTYLSVLREDPVAQCIADLCPL